MQVDLSIGQSVNQFVISAPKLFFKNGLGAFCILPAQIYITIKNN